MQVVATTLQQIGEGVRGFRVVDAMPVFHHQREGLSVGMQVIDQGIQDILFRIFQMPFEFLL